LEVNKMTLKDYDMVETKDGYICVPITALFKHLATSKAILTKQKQDTAVINALLEFYKNIYRKFLIDKEIKKRGIEDGKSKLPESTL